MNRPSLFGSLLLTLLAGSLSAAQDHEHRGGISLEKAGQLFRTSCVNCHTAPDVRFATDRAWLDQVYDTA